MKTRAVVVVALIATLCVMVTPAGLESTNSTSGRMGSFMSGVSQYCKKTLVSRSMSVHYQYYWCGASYNTASWEYKKSWTTTPYASCSTTVSSSYTNAVNWGRCGVSTGCVAGTSQTLGATNYGYSFNPYTSDICY